MEQKYIKKLSCLLLHASSEYEIQNNKNKTKQQKKQKNQTKQQFF
jgi:hypothetical protein